MKVVVCDKKQIHLMDGPRGPGDVVELPDKLALRYLQAGAVERYETKVIREVPSQGPGEAQPSSASPVAPASPQATAKPSRRGGSRKKKGAE